MKKASIILILIILGFLGIAEAEEDSKIHFDFETSNHDWIIPDWAYMQDDHVAETVEISEKVSSSGKKSLAIICDFPGDIWRAALIERKGDMDLTGYKTISADIYIPKGAQRGLIKARFILTIGEGWLFTEMRQTFFLKPEKWITVKANLESEETEKSAWKGGDEKSLFHHIDKIKKIAIRIEYDAAPPHRIGRRYQGPIYVDNIVIE